jgi:hypothetical protein
MDAPIFLHELDVQSINCIKYIIPSCYAGGHEDIEITADYGEDTNNNPGNVRYNAWARKGNASVKFFVFTNEVPTADDAIESIMADMNENPEFEAAMQRLVAFIEKK